MNNRLMKVVSLLFGAFFIGAAIASFISILFAPKKGAEMRNQIANMVKRLTSRRSKLIKKVAGHDIRDIKSKKAPMSWFERWSA